MLYKRSYQKKSYIRKYYHKFTLLLFSKLLVYILRAMAVLTRLTLLLYEILRSINSLLTRIQRKTKLFNDIIIICLVLLLIMTYHQLLIYELRNNSGCFTCFHISHGYLISFYTLQGDVCQLFSLSCIQLTRHCNG